MRVYAYVQRVYSYIKLWQGITWSFLRVETILRYLSDRKFCQLSISDTRFIAQALDFECLLKFSKIDFRFDFQNSSQLFEKLK